MPEIIGRKKRSTFAALVQRIKQKVNSWNSKFLSYAGREIMIKAVITAIPSYLMTAFALLRSICQEITKIIRNFWWKGNSDSKGINWVKWDKVTRPKMEGGIGFRDIEAFNVALLGKQAWRVVQHPDSLLAKILKAKHYSRSHFLSATIGSRPSYAWKSLLKGRDLVAQGLSWIIGDGSRVRLEKDYWISQNGNHRPPRLLAPSLVSNLNVSHLINPHSRTWNNALIDDLIAPEDVDLVKRTRIGRYTTKDVPRWNFNTNGIYTVRSGYKFLISQQKASSSSTTSEPTTHTPDKNLYHFIWNLHCPPKIKHFIWRSLNNAIPVLSRLRARGMLQDPTCVRCGEQDETTTHCLFTCRVSKKIWNLAPITFFGRSPTDQDSMKEIITSMMSLSTDPSIQLFPFLLWRIWKSKNSFLYEDKKWGIPNIITQAIADNLSWDQANQVNNDEPSHSHSNTTNLVHVPQPLRPYICLIDASWLSCDHDIGLGWILKDQHDNVIVHGRGRQAATASVAEAEAQALLLAVTHLSTLNYNNISIMMDSKQVVDQFNYINQRKKISDASTSIALQDALFLLRDKHFNLIHIPRSQNEEADRLAKHARLLELSVVISWNPL